MLIGKISLLWYCKLRKEVHLFYFFSQSWWSYSYEPPSSDTIPYTTSILKLWSANTYLFKITERKRKKERNRASWFWSVICTIATRMSPGWNVKITYPSSRISCNMRRLASVFPIGTFAVSFFFPLRDFLFVGLTFPIAKKKGLLATEYFTFHQVEVLTKLPMQSRANERPWP